MTVLLLPAASDLPAQAAVHQLPAWQAELPQSNVARPIPLQRESLRARSHTGTGLLIGGIVGVAATTIFLIGFCSDADTECGLDEVGRAVVFIAVPAAAVGALIGSLITEE